MTQLFQNKKTFSQFFAAFLKTSLNFGHFGKKGDPHIFCISDITDFKNVVRYMSKKISVSDDFSKSNLVNMSKHF